MNISGIYQIQSKIKPNRIYIGSSIDIATRWKEHISKLRKNKHKNLRLQHHFNKYGFFDLNFSILIGCDKSDLITNEQFFIDSLNPWFNIHKKADSPLGLKRSEESKRKRSIDSIGEKNHFFGKKHTEESNEKRREWNRLHPVTKETREKQRQSLIKFYENKKLKELELMNKN
jgi:group I intron endonuclease